MGRSDSGAASASDPQPDDGGAVSEGLSPAVSGTAASSAHIGEEELQVLLGTQLRADEPTEAVLVELSGALAELRSIVQSHMARERGEPATMDLPRWLGLCKEAGMTDQGLLQRAFERACALPSALSTEGLDELHVYACVIELARELRSEGGGLPASLHGLLYDCLLPFASRDTSTGFARVLGTRVRPVVEDIRRSFSGCGVTWEHWLAIWQSLDLSFMPGFAESVLELEVFAMLSEHFGAPWPPAPTHRRRIHPPRRQQHGRQRKRQHTTVRARARARDARTHGTPAAGLASLRVS